MNKKKTVAIVGNGRTRVHAPHDNMKMDVWTMNNHAYLWQKRTTAVFEMHPDALTTNRYDEGYKAWLRQPHDFPIYMHERNDEIPSSVTYPLLAASLNRFLVGQIIKCNEPIGCFYTSTFPYCLALAVAQKYYRVELYGVDLDKEERIAHRDAVFLWIGIAACMGLEIVVPCDSPLLNDERYPFTLKGTECPNLGESCDMCMRRNR